jgi:hypothetical protein
LPTSVDCNPPVPEPHLPPEETWRWASLRGSTRSPEGCGAPQAKSLDGFPGNVGIGARPSSAFISARLPCLCNYVGETKRAAHSCDSRLGLGGYLTSWLASWEVQLVYVVND